MNPFSGSLPFNLFHPTTTFPLSSVSTIYDSAFGSMKSSAAKFPLHPLASIPDTRTRDINRVTILTVRRASADLARPEEVVRGAFQKGGRAFSDGAGSQTSFFLLSSFSPHSRQLSTVSRCRTTIVVEASRFIPSELAFSPWSLRRCVCIYT